jgi:hypothetical protein
MREILTSLAINLFAGILIFLVGLFWPLIPKSLNKFRLMRFWGKAVFGNNLVISYGTLIDSRLVQPNPPQFRFIKRYHSSPPIQITGPFGNIVGDCEIRSASYIINALSTYRKKAVNVMDDQTAFSNLNRTYIALGSPSSNEISSVAMNEPNNNFLYFLHQPNAVYIVDKQTNKRFTAANKDYGLILKIPNLRFPPHFFFVCAGLGEWGTSGASWYLASKWRELQKEFDKGFGIVVEVDIGSDESARRVFP